MHELLDLLLLFVSRLLFPFAYGVVVTSEREGLPVYTAAEWKRRALVMTLFGVPWRVSSNKLQSAKKNDGWALIGRIMCHAQPCPSAQQLMSPQNNIQNAPTEIAAAPLFLTPRRRLFAWERRVAWHVIRNTDHYRSAPANTSCIVYTIYKSKPKSMGQSVLRI